jgi:acyl-homoserine-lactone acylase
VIPLIFTTMKQIAFLLLLILPFGVKAQPFSASEVSRWKQQAQNVTIIRDNWGIPHIYGKTDADAVFGLLYAQCEDDFPRVEANYIEKLGRQAEVKGRGALYEDLLHRLVLDSSAAKKDYANAPLWLKKLCNAYADGINYFLATHPDIKPALLNRFEPWWPFMWTDGSIGAISTGGATQQELQSFYSGEAVAALPPRLDDENEIGSNGFAFSPKLTQSGKSILYINPHVTFYFRPEVHMVSEEGLNAYGAVTWGQFFIYQGFNEACGWMHTSSQADVADLYAEKVKAVKGKFEYAYEGKSKPVAEKEIRITINENGVLSQKVIRTFETHHGPVVAKRDGQWLTLKHHNRSAKGLEQSWLRTKAKSFAEFKQVMYMKENTSNNTVYADREGNVAYWHGNFMPKRDPKLDWSKPVDGTTGKTEWGPLHMVDDMVTIYNPKSGWIQNCNSTPATVAGEGSPYLYNFPKYMAPDAENFRGINAVQHCLEVMPKSLDIDKTIALGYTRRLPAMEYIAPALLRGLKSTGFANPDHKAMYDLLAAWKYDSDTGSIATTLAIETAEKMLPFINRTESAIMNDKGFVGKLITYCDKAPDSQLVRLLESTRENLEKRFGQWRVSWGEINRYQRLTGQLTGQYDDSKSSIPARFAAATWGALPSYVSRQMPGTQKRYGYSGNSFICAVEFGEKIKAKSLLAGGNSNNPLSPHFGDQASMYANGNFKEVLFYREDVLKHAEKTYKPGL